MSVVLVDGDREYFLQPGANAVGRDSRVNEIHLEDGLISRVHAWIVGFEDGTWAVLDRRSSNGTYVWGRLVECRVLQDGDELLLGDTRLVFRNPEAREEEVERSPEELVGVEGRFRELAAPPGEASSKDREFDLLHRLHHACTNLLEAETRGGLRRRAVEEMVGLFDANRAHYFPVSPVQPDEVISRHEDPFQQVRPALESLLHRAAAIAVDQARPQLWGDVNVAFGIPGSHCQEYFNVRSAMAVPVRSARWSGALLVNRRVQGACYGPAELEVFEEFGRVVQSLEGALPEEH